MKADVDAMEEKRAARIEKFEKLRGEAERVLSEKSQELERVKSEGEKQLATLQFLIRYGPLCNTLYPVNIHAVVTSGC